VGIVGDRAEESRVLLDDRENSSDSRKVRIIDGEVMKKDDGDG
jgi:hypothetical protein